MSHLFWAILYLISLFLTLYDAGVLGCLVGWPLASMVYRLNWAFLIVVGELEALWWQLGWTVSKLFRGKHCRYYLPSEGFSSVFCNMSYFFARSKSSSRGRTTNKLTVEKVIYLCIMRYGLFYDIISCKVPLLANDGVVVVDKPQCRFRQKNPAGRNVALHKRQLVCQWCKEWRWTSMVCKMKNQQAHRSICQLFTIQNDA